LTRVDDAKHKGELVLESFGWGVSKAAAPARVAAEAPGTLGDVLVSSFQEIGSAGEVPLETVSLTYAKVELAYRPQAATGMVAPPVNAGFDVKLGKAL
jgi:hypothetical protein